MEPPFDAYPARLHCGISREVIDRQPEHLSPVEVGLLAITPSPDVAGSHDHRHLVSFARHLAELIASPIRKVEASGHTFYAVLGVVVFHRRADGTFETAMWQRPTDDDGDWLVDFLPWDTPILDFPRTTLWQNNIRQGLICEARTRIGDTEAADRWAAWVWGLLEERLIQNIDLRRLRSRIRHGLELDGTTLSMMRRRRRECASGSKPSVLSYNSTRSEAETLSQLRSCSEFASILASWLTLPEVSSAGSLEATARFKDACLTAGIKPRQWRLLAHPRSPLLPALRSFMREFAGDPHREPGEDFLGLIRMLKPTKRIDVEVWRSFLSMCGTRKCSPESYAESLAPLADTLCHILRILEAGKAPRDRDQRYQELHEICAWVADAGIKQLRPQQRRLGWKYLFTQAQRHTSHKRRSEALRALQWSVPLKPITLGELTATPLTCGSDLWEESVAMRHCADMYGSRCMSGSTLIISVRTLEGKRKATLAFTRREDDWKLAHAVGPANRQVGKQYDEMIDEILEVLSGGKSDRQRSAKRARYRVEVLDNFNPGASWGERVFPSLEAALGAARQICKDGLPTMDAYGLDSWYSFGETPLIIPLDDARPVDFSAVDYINKLCNRKQQI